MKWWTYFQLFIENIIFGDLLKEQAKKISDLLENVDISPLPKELTDIERVYISPKNIVRKNVKVKLDCEANASVNV